MERVIPTLLKWYKITARNLPWRETNDPYKIWISEIILQQTRVVQGLGYYNRFVLAFPNIHALANASEQEILKSWQGLGYYARARNMHKAAKLILSEHGGVFPNNVEMLLALPGIGNYTASAIASFAYGLPEPAIDGNVKRVGARFFGLYEPIQTSQFYTQLHAVLRVAIVQTNANIFNQAMIEVGALLCLPKQPKCEECPLNSHCVAFLNKLQNQIPVTVQKQKPMEKYRHYLCLHWGDTVAIRMRNESGIYQHLYEFPAVSREDKLDHLDAILALFGIVDNISIISKKTFKHQLTHQTIYATCWYLRISDDKFVSPSDWEWHNKESIANLPIHRLMEKMIKFT